MKKGLTIVGIILAVIIIAMIAIPTLFKGKIKDTVLSIANEQLNAKVDIKDFGLNLFSNFPNATLSLNNTTVIGIEDFAQDTLLQAESASVTIDLFSLFGDNYKISKINLDKASVLAKILANGRANWDIMKEEPADDTAEATESSPFNLSLKKISINDCNIIYQDDSTKMKAIVKKWNGNISGDFSASQTTLDIESTIDELSFIMDGIPYLSKVKAKADAAINADLDNMKFTFTESNLQINELKAAIDGSFAMVGEEGEDMDFDLKLNAPSVDFKEILSLVPAMYTADFKDVKTSGTASMDAYIKGLMQGENYPAFDVKILVNNAMFQYPSLPKSVNDINVDLAINSKGGSLDNTVINISKFGFNLGGNPFSGNLNITTPMSDMNVKMHANGTIDLGMIKDVYPLEEGTDLNGKLIADLSVATRMSAIEKEQYENVSASGHLKVNDMVYKATDMPEVLINNAALEFTPRYVNLPALDVKIGKNDISANGRLENFIAYALKDQTLKGQLNIKSNYLNANDFMGDETETAADTTATSEDIIIPKNIDFALNAALNQVVYSNINITNMVGNMSVKNGILTLHNVGANALGGSCKVNGSYDTSDPQKPKVDFDLALNKVSFAETFKSVESIQKFAPIFESLIGTYSMNLKFNTSLGESILQTLSGLTGSGALQTSDVKVEGVAALTALSSALKTDALKSISPKDLNLPFSIDNGQIVTKPFNVNIGNGGMLKLEGSTGLDQSINYKGTVTLPKSLSNNIINNVPITIGGTFTSPKIGVDTKALVTDAASSAINKLLGGKDGEDVDVSTKLSEEKAKQIEKLRSEANSAAEKLVTEAEKQAKNLEEKAGKNAIAKAAAKAAGKKLVDEAKKQADNLKNKAEEQIKKLEGGEEVNAE